MHLSELLGYFCEKTSLECFAFCLYNDQSLYLQLVQCRYFVSALRIEMFYWRYIERNYTVGLKICFNFRNRSVNPDFNKILVLWH